jgi:hypothetical protein
MDVMQDETQKTVRQTVWPWDAPAPRPVDAHAALRRKALIQALVMATVAAVVFFTTTLRSLPVVLSVLSLVNVVLGLVAPPAFALIDRGLLRFGTLCGQGATWLLLAPFFYLFFVPARLWMALRGRDPLNRTFPDTHPTYWLPRRPVTNPDEYRKQF